MNRRPDPYARAEAAIDQALKLDPNSGHAHARRAWFMLLTRRKDECLVSIDKALALASHQPTVLHMASIILMHLGNYDRAMALWQKADELDPSAVSWTYWTPLHVHRVKGEYEDAYRYALILKQLNGAWHWVPATEAYLLAYMGRMGEAREALERALKINPEFATVARNEISAFWWSQPDQIDHIMNGLHNAGLERPAL